MKQNYLLILYEILILFHSAQDILYDKSNPCVLLDVGSPPQGMLTPSSHVKTVPSPQKVRNRNLSSSSSNSVGKTGAAPTAARKSSSSFSTSATPKAKQHKTQVIQQAAYVLHVCVSLNYCSKSQGTN